MNIETIREDDGLRRLLATVIAKRGLVGDADLKFSIVSEAGDGYSGVTCAVQATGKNGTVKLFVKVAPKSEALRSQFFIEECYVREITFYETIYPNFIKFQSNNSFKNTVPKCYGIISDKKNETLILEDLKEKGYVMLNRRETWSEDLLAFIFKQYAKFHAISFAMRDQDPSLYGKITENMTEFFGENVKAFGLGNIFEQYSEETKKMFDPATESDILKALENLTGEHLDFFFNIKEHVDEYSVIIHGDAWCNNLMFKFQNETNQTIPDHMKIIDWQLSRVNSPVLDLIHIFYTTASKKVMANLEYFQKIYYDALSESIREMGSNPEKSYPYSVFVAHWKKFSRYGLFIALVMVKLMLTEKEEARDMTEACESGTLADNFVYQIKEEDLYNRRIRDIIYHFVENKFL